MDLRMPERLWSLDKLYAGGFGKAHCGSGRRSQLWHLLPARLRLHIAPQALGQNGGHIVAQKTIYGGSYNLMAHTLPGFGITASFVNIHNLDEVEAAIQDNTRAIYIETLGNPNSDIPDIDALAGLSPPDRYGLPLVEIIPLVHLISFVRSSMEPILSCILLQSSLEAMVLRWEDSS